MKKSIFVVVALMAAMVLSFSSCKSDAEKIKSATESFKTACKDKDAEAAKKYYKEVQEVYYTAKIDAYKSSKTKDEYEEATKELKAAHEEFVKIKMDCDCLDYSEVRKEIENKYKEEYEKAREDAKKRWKENK